MEDTKKKHKRSTTLLNARKHTLRHDIEYSRTTNIIEKQTNANDNMCGSCKQTTINGNNRRIGRL